MTNPSKYSSHCCGDMEEALDIESGEVISGYDPQIRKYFLIVYENSKPNGFRKPMLYCPWCATELPKELDEEWGETLEKEHGLTTDDFWDANGNWDESKIPPEFRTDEWWKKRGL